MMKYRPWVAGLLWLMTGVIGLKLAKSYAEQRHWMSETGRLQAELAALPPGPPTPVPSVPKVSDVSAKEEEEVPVSEALARLNVLIQTVLAAVEKPADLATYGPRHPRQGQAVAIIGKLPVSEWKAMVKTDPEFFFLRAESHRSMDPSELARLFILRNSLECLAKAEPAQALRLMESATPETWAQAPTLQRLVDDCLKSWAEQDAAAAFRWISRQAVKIPEGETRAGHALRHAARIDFHAAWKLAEEELVEQKWVVAAFLDGARTREDLDFLMSQLSHDPEAKGDEVGLDSFQADVGLIATSYQRACTGGARKLLASHGFAAAKAFLDRWAPEASVREMAVSPMAENIVAETGTTARSQAEWWLAQYSEPRREEASASLASRWADVSFSECAAWLQSQPAGPVRDAGLDRLCRKLAPFDAISAEQWAVLIQNENHRGETMTRIKRLTAP